MLTRKEKSKETVSLLKNLLAIDNKKTKETIEAFLKIFFIICLESLHSHKNYFYIFICVPFLSSVFQTWKKLSRFLEKFIFRENNFREFLV